VAGKTFDDFAWRGAEFHESRNGKVTHSQMP